MTLLETLIAMSLVSFLLVLVFGFFYELSVLNKSTKADVKEAFVRRYAQSRLMYVFSHVVNENLNGGKEFYFFSLKDEASSDPSLILTFDNDSVLDPHVSGNVVGRLFVADKALYLAIWPLRKKGDLTEDLGERMHMERLLDNVGQVRFKFFSAPDVEHTVASQTVNEENPPKGKWLGEWEKKYKQMPVIIQMEVTEGKTEGKKEQKGKNEPKVHTFKFVLPSSKHPITFGTKS
jgi:hypothetical protein